MAIDLTEYEHEYEWLSVPGEYLFTVEKQEKKSIKSAKADTVLEVTCRADDGQYQKLSLFWTEKAMWRVSKFASACGFDKEARQSFELEDLVGCTFVGKVVPSDNPKYHEIGEYWRVPQNEPEKLRVFDEEKPKETEAAGVAEATEAEDDIPF